MTDLFNKNKEYVYDCIGFEKNYGIYDTIDELRSADKPWRIFKTNLELIEDCKKELIIEIGKWLKKWNK